MKKALVLFIIWNLITVHGFSQAGEFAILKGTLMTTDEGFTGTEVVVAEDISTKKKIATKKGDIIYKSEAQATYTLKVPPGQYYVYTVPSPTWGQASWYTEFVLCGLKYDCPSHKKIVVNAVKGKTILKVDPQDMYYTDEKQLEAPPAPKTTQQPLETTPPPVAPKKPVETTPAQVEVKPVTRPASSETVKAAEPTKAPRPAYTMPSSQQFRDKEGVFELSIPDNWVIVKSKSSLLLAEDPEHKGRRLDIDKFIFSSNVPTIEQFSKDQLAAFPGGKNTNGDVLNSSGFINTDALQWWFIDYTSRKNTRYRCYQVLHNNTKYNVYYISPAADFDKGLPLAESMLRSFRFLR